MNLARGILLTVWALVACAIAWRGIKSHLDLTPGRVVAIALVWPVVLLALVIEEAIDGVLRK